MARARAMALGFSLAATLSAQPILPPLVRLARAVELYRTLDFLRAHLSANARVNFSMLYTDRTNGATWVEKRSPEVANLRTNGPGCRIDYDWRWVTDGHLDMVQHAAVLFAEVREVEVLPAEVVSREADMRGGHRQWEAKAEPPVFVVRVDRPGGESNFPFYDEGLARRVAVKLSRAAELCGGHAPLPAPAHAAPLPGNAGRRTS